MRNIRWIRSPWWDGFWILSGVPIGIVLMLCAPNVVPPLAISIMVLESAHVVSPILLAWTHPGLRMIVVDEWPMHIITPVAVVIGVLLVPAYIVSGIYFAWNIYHFGMQNYGVASLYRVWQNRALLGVVCLGSAAICMGVIPLVFPDPRLYMLFLGMFSFNHWLTDIGLSSTVARHHWGFITFVLAMGVAWLLLRNGPLSVHVVPQIIAIRQGIGMVHFIYSARIWRFGDPKIQAVMGTLVRSAH